MKGKWMEQEHFWWLPEVKTCFLEGIRLVRAFGESRDLVFSPSRSNLGLVSSRLAGFVRNRKIYNLCMVSGPVLLKIKGNSLIFIFWGQTNETKNRTNPEVGQMLVSGALDRTKKIRKTAADIFAKSGLGKPWRKNKGKLRMSLGFSEFFLWT